MNQTLRYTLEQKEYNKKLYMFLLTFLWDRYQIAKRENPNANIRQLSKIISVELDDPHRTGDKKEYPTALINLNKIISEAN